MDAAVPGDAGLDDVGPDDAGAVDAGLNDAGPGDAGSESPLTLSPIDFDFGEVALGESATATFTLRNVGGSDLSDLSLSLSAPIESAAHFVIDGNDCPAVLSSASKCEIQVRFSPGAERAFEAEIQARDSSGAVASARLAGRGAYLRESLTLTRLGRGAGSVRSVPAGLDCQTACTTRLPIGPIELTATADSGSFFAGWRGACSGRQATCALNHEAETEVIAIFVETPSPLLITDLTDIDPAGAPGFEGAGPRCKTLTVYSPPQSGIYWQENGSLGSRQSSETYGYTDGAENPTPGPTWMRFSDGANSLCSSADLVLGAGESVVLSFDGEQRRIWLPAYVSRSFDIQPSADGSTWHDEAMTNLAEPAR